ncbi:MAG: Hpt domain-containing protein, partial [Balneolaceae bacterium]|nr:Hpt domain-containing protein [Balneolaceae bacterium]
MVEMFLENAPPTLENLKTHESESNWEKLAAEAHKFKPTLSYMGMEDAKDLLIEIEQDAKNESNLESIDARIDELQSYCEQAYDELQTELKQLQGG